MGRTRSRLKALRPGLGTEGASFMVGASSGVLMVDGDWGRCVNCLPTVVANNGCFHGCPTSTQCGPTGCEKTHCAAKPLSLTDKANKMTRASAPAVRSSGKLLTK